MKKIILNKVDDLVSCFLYDDRKGDEDLPRGVIEEAVKSGVPKPKYPLGHYVAGVTVIDGATHIEIGKKVGVSIDGKCYWRKIC